MWNKVKEWNGRQEENAQRNISLILLLASLSTIVLSLG
jgi:hypothetical protein